jgi:predicted acylesterase/phospholipase RssA
MFQLKSNVLFTAVEKIPTPDGQEIPDNYRPVVFSNLNLKPTLEGQAYPVWQCVMASGSAPLYLPPTLINGSPQGRSYVDGGVYQNNPSNIALTIANILYPNATRISVLSVGCGLGTVGFFEPEQTAPTAGIADNVQDNLEYLTQILGISSTGAQEAVARELELNSVYGMRINNANLFSYRFQTVYDPSVNTELDNSSPEFLAYMQTSANAQYELDLLKIQLFIQKLQG